MRSPLLAAAALLLAVATPCAAQHAITLRAGTSIASFGGADAEDIGDSSTGVSVGASYVAPITETVGLHLGLGYAQKGAEESAGGFTVGVSLDYLEVPVLLRVGIPSTGSVSAHLMFGPALGIEVSCTGEFSGQGGSVSADCDEEDNTRRKYDIGAMAGFGVDAQVSEALTLVFDVFYNLGLTSLDEAGDDVKNRAVTIQAGVALPIG